MIHTALQITPEDITPKVDRATLRKRLFQPQRRGEVSEKNAEPIAGPGRTGKPVSRVWAVQHDSHVMAYIEWKGNHPLGYLKLRCREIGVSYRDIVGGNLKRDVCKTRGDLIAEVKTRFPELSLPAIGNLFGDMDHTSIRSALINRGVISGDMTRSFKHALRHADLIHKRLAEGVAQYKIAQELNVGAPAISQAIRYMGWRYVSPAQRSSLDNHADTIKAMFDAAAPIKDIAREVGRGRTSVGDYIKRKGWTREPIQHHAVKENSIDQG